MPASKPFVPLSTRFDHALLFAAQVHRNQDRKRSGIPYVSHLLGVASIVLDYGGDEELAIAALLHDAAEDHGGRAMLHTIEQMFGPRVSKVVDGCTGCARKMRRPASSQRRTNSTTRGLFCAT